MRTGRKKGRTSCPRHRRGHQQNQKHVEEQGGGETLLSAGGVRSSREWGKMQTDRQSAWFWVLWGRSSLITLRTRENSAPAVQ